MTETVVGGLAGGMLPPRTIPSGAVGASPPAALPTVAADATSPVWQPWMNSQAQALSRLKTEIQRSLATYDRSTGHAGRLLDTARAIANEQTKRLEDAAWAAFNTYMTEAAGVYDGIMGPAVHAYSEAIGKAHSQLVAELGPIQSAYARIAADAGWTETLPNGGAKI